MKLLKIIASGSPLFNDKWSNHKVIKNKYELEGELDKFYKN